MNPALEPDCRHVAPNDGKFAARMRFHQSWYRGHVLNLPPGPNPAARGAAYGNMLRPEDGRRGYNFLNAAIHRCAEARLAAATGMVEPQRLRNNLLSSQPMCFNLFAPLSLDNQLATELVARLPGVAPDLEITGVTIEYAPPKATHLHDGTAFDAFLEYTRLPNRRGFIGVETKLTEPFSQARYDGERTGYARWLSQPESWWQAGVGQHFGDARYNQLWRNHLLAYAMLHQDEPVYDEGYCAVLYHPADTTCAAALGAYREHVRPAATFTLLEWRLDAIISTWFGLVDENRERREWLNAFRLRYLDLSASQPAWEDFRTRS